jgi:hypothetical protein
MSDTESRTTARTAYLLPGKYEDLNGHLGSVISRLGFRILGRELTPEFTGLWFQEQLDLIRADLEQLPWSSTDLLLGRSLGGYLLLHTLSEMSSFPGKVLLLSPVLGAAMAQTEQGIFVSRPPRADLLLQLVASGAFPVPGAVEIHTGMEDHGCDPRLAREFAAALPRCALRLVAEAGHELGEAYVESVVAGFAADAGGDE